MNIVERVYAMFRHHLVRKTVILQIGSVVGTLVQALAGVFVARLLQPERYGQYALAFSVASITSLFIGGGITDAVTPSISRAWVQGDRRALGATVGFYLRFVAVCAVITLSFITLLPLITAHLYHDARIGGYAIGIIIASIVSVSVFAPVQLMLQVAGRIRTLAGLTFADAAIRYGAMLSLVIAGFGIWGAVAGHMVGAVIVLGLAAMLYVGLEREHELAPRFRELLGLARGASWKPLLKPTLWVLADSNFALLYGALPVALVGLSVSGAELAYFKLAFGYLILAMSAMGPVSTVMNVHFPTIQTTDPARLRRSFIQVTRSAIALSIFITAVAVAISPFVFRLLYGSVYLPAVPYVYGLAVFGALFGLGVGLGPMWRALNKINVSILINSITLGLGIPIGLLCIRTWHLWGAVVMVTLWYTLSHAVSFIYLVRALKKQS